MTLRMSRLLSSIQSIRSCSLLASAPSIYPSLLSLTADSSSPCSTSSAASNQPPSSWAQLLLSRGMARKKPAAAAPSPVDDHKAEKVSVVLLMPIPMAGKKGSVVSVNAGWMRHELFPEGQAVYATPENIKEYGMSVEQQAVDEDPKVLAERRLVKLINSLNTMVVHISRRNNFLKKQADTMIDSVSAWDVLQACERQYGVRLHESHLLMEGNISSFGTFKVPLNLRTKEDRQVELTVCIDSVRWINHGRNYV